MCSMADGAAAPRLGFKELVPIVCSIAGLLVVLSGALRADGGRDKQLDDNTRRIERLEAADSAKTETLSRIDGRTIRIETKLELIVPTKGVTTP